MELVPIQKTLEENPELAQHPDSKDSIARTIGYYKIIGFAPPWIGYYAKLGDRLVGNAAFKGAPVDGKVEIAYATFDEFRQRGVATRACSLLIDLALKTDPNIVITARTLPEKNHSTRVLEKNNFEFAGPVMDKEDGEVWEWVYKKKN